MLAARVGDAMSAELLVGAGANANEKGPQGMTALVLAASSGQQEVATLLLEKSADANARDEYGATALHYAVTKGISVLNGVRYADDVSALFRPSEIALVEALLRHGANPNVQLETRRRLAAREARPPSARHRTCSPPRLMTDRHADAGGRGRRSQDPDHDRA